MGVGKKEGFQISPFSRLKKLMERESDIPLKIESKGKFVINYNRNVTFMKNCTCPVCTNSGKRSEN
jgi:hypothetical protein